MRAFAVSLICAAALLASSVSQAQSSWDADYLYNNGRGYSDTRLIADGRDVARVPMAWIRAAVEARNRIQAEAGVYSKLLISDRPVINAYADSSGGQNTIVVTLKMLELLRGDESATAALLGHETAHLYLGHSFKRRATTSFLVFLGNLAANVLEAKLQAKGAFSGLGTQLAEAGTELVVAKFSRDQERDADKWGTQWMLKLGYEPQGALRLHQQFLAHTGDDDSFFNTHPPTSERLSSIQALVAQHEQAKRAQVAMNPGPSIYPVGLPQSSVQLSGKTNGQVGVILSLKPRYNYVIFSGTTARELAVDTPVRIVGSDGVEFSAKIARAIDGYYSAIVSGDVGRLRVGDRIEGY